jgi:nucleoside-diphosphate-sugar epimerase
MKDSAYNWKGKRVLVTGGSSFIGSHLIDKLLDRGAEIRIVDDLSSGKLGNITKQLEDKNNYIEFIRADLRDPGVSRRAMESIDVVFHLAADHGGRGYVDLHQAGPASNLFLDGVVFWEALRAGVEKIVFASSGCVYPNNLQTDVKKELYLTEDLVKPPYDADNMYGWAKLMAEDTLKAYSREHGLKTASCRYFTVYGPRGVENHAVIAMIARAFLKQDPYEIWGDGQQIRNWTHVYDIVEGTILAAEKIDDGTALNLGTMERIRVIEAAEMINKLAKHNPKYKFLKNMPTGPVNRVADNSLAKKILGWEPKIKFKDGVKQTFEWYFETKDKKEVVEIFEKMLTER